MAIALYIVVGLVLLVVLGLVLLGRSGRRIARGRFGRMARISRLSTRLWTSWLGAKLRRLFTAKDKRATYDEARRKADAEAVTRTMGEMKGAFMKIGQMMSFISDSIPPEYRKALASLQASAPPMDFALIRDVAERELGRPLERAFARFDAEPIASASIGQVHRARLPSGEEVAVKIQYPGVADAIRSDMKNAAVLYRMMSVFYPALDPKPVVAELQERVGEELDYVREARNQKAFGELYEGHPFVRIPKVFDSHSTSMVLTSEYVAGTTFADIEEQDDHTRSLYGEMLYRFIFGSIIRFGVFNGDPHPGNYIFDHDGRVVFLDFGCVKYFPDDMLHGWMLLVKAHLDGDPVPFRERAVALGFLKHDSAIDAQTIYDYFGYFYDPIRADREYTFTREFNAKSLGMVFKPEGKFSGMQKQLNMPPDFVFANRIQWGVYSILARLEAKRNWHRIHREYLLHEAPRTALGQEDAAHRHEWLRRRALDPGGDYVLRQDGIRLRANATRAEAGSPTAAVAMA